MGRLSSTEAAFQHPTAVVDEGARIGPRTRVWHFCHIMAGAQVGADCVLGQNCFVGTNVAVGDRVRIQNNVSVYEGVELEEDVFCGPGMVFTNVRNPRAEVSRKHELSRTLVKRGATIGANATILPGITLGEYCFVGAGAVVTQDVPEYALVVGVPAHHVGWVSRYAERLTFESNGRAPCPVSGQLYCLREGRVDLESTPPRSP